MRIRLVLALLVTVLGALNTWGDAHSPAPTGGAARFVEATTGEPVTLSFVAADGRALAPTEVSAVRLPAVEGAAAG